MLQGRRALPHDERIEFAARAPHPDPLPAKSGEREQGRGVRGNLKCRPRPGVPAAGDQVAGCGTIFAIARSAVSLLPRVSGPRSTAITTTTRKKIVLIIIGMAKPMFICTA